MEDIRDAHGHLARVLPQCRADPLSFRLRPGLTTFSCELDHLCDLLAAVGKPQQYSDLPHVFQVVGPFGDAAGNLVRAIEGKVGGAQLVQCARRVDLLRLKLRYLLKSSGARELCSDKRHNAQGPAGCDFCPGFDPNRDDTKLKRRRELVGDYLKIKCLLRGSSAFEHPHATIEVFERLHDGEYVAAVLEEDRINDNNTTLAEVTNNFNRIGDPIPRIRRLVNALVRHLNAASSFGRYEAKRIQWLRFLRCMEILSTIKASRIYLTYGSDKPTMEGLLAQKGVTFQGLVTELEMDLFRIIAQFAGAASATPGSRDLPFLDPGISAQLARAFAWTFHSEDDDQSLSGQFIYRGSLPRHALLAPNADIFQLGPDAVKSALTVQRLQDTGLRIRIADKGVDVNISAAEAANLILRPDYSASPSDAVPPANLTIEYTRHGTDRLVTQPFLFQAYDDDFWRFQQIFTYHPVWAHSHNINIILYNTGVATPSKATWYQGHVQLWADHAERYEVDNHVGQKVYNPRHAQVVVIGKTSSSSQLEIFSINFNRHLSISKRSWSSEGRQGGEIIIKPPNVTSFTRDKRKPQDYITVNTIPKKRKGRLDLTLFGASKLNEELEQTHCDYLYMRWDESRKSELDRFEGYLQKLKSRLGGA